MGRAPLHLAAASGNCEALNYLIAHAADKGHSLDLNATSNGGETALHKAVLFCKPESLKILLEAGADPTLETLEGESIFALADRSQNAQIQRVIQVF